MNAAPPTVRRVASTRLPTASGEFGCFGFEDDAGEHHVALVMGEVATVGDDEPVLVRVHSECLTGDVFGSRRCDCGPQLQLAMRLVAAAGRGVVVYLCGHEGRGIGIGEKLRAYELQDDGLDTVDANLELGFPVDLRDYGVAAAVLADLGVRRVRLLTNNPSKVRGLEAHGVVVVDLVPVVTEPTPENEAYLRTKRDRLGHTL